MSFDLMVIEPAAVPDTKSAFSVWYAKTTAWGGDHDHDDPANTSLALRAWFMDMIETFPAMNGPFAADEADIDNPNVSDYCIVGDAIYVGFAWSAAEAAGEAVLNTAEKHGLTVYDPQSDTIFKSGVDGQLNKLSQDPVKTGFWAKLTNMFGKKS